MTASDSHFWSTGALMTTSRKSLLIGWGCRQLYAEPPPGSLAFYFPDFFLRDHTPWHVYGQWKECSYAEAAALFATAGEEVLPINWQMPAYAEWDSAVSQVKKLIASGELVKAVPYLFATAQAQMRLGQLKRSLTGAIGQADRYGSSCYAYWNGESGVVGATPELLAAWDRDSLHTVACAGTALSPEQLWRPKEEEEHTIVIEDLKRVLSHYGLFEQLPTEVVQAGALYHLLTPIKVRLNHFIGLSELISRLHPTPALGASPRAAGEAWLLSYDQRYPRDHYGAPVGYQLPDGQRACYVAIRQLQWNQKGYRLGAGCGVTAASDIQEEWEEWKAKVAAVRHFLSV